MYDFLTEYHEKDPATWELTAAQVGSYGGYVTDGHVFYFVEPGVAAELTIDRSRFPQEALLEPEICAELSERRRGKNFFEHPLESLIQKSQHRWLKIDHATEIIKRRGQGTQLRDP